MPISTAQPPALSISVDKVCFIVLKARQFLAKDVLTDPGDSSNPADDGMRSVLEDHVNDPVHLELKEFIDALTQDERIDLVALMWLGRGDGDLADWNDLRGEAARARNDRTGSYLLGSPLLPDHLENGLALMGRSCGESEIVPP